MPLLRAIAPGTVISTEELGRATIRAARQGAPKRVLENRDLRTRGYHLTNIQQVIHEYSGGHQTQKIR